ncbi:hypothetical protein R3P38DRAFT_2808797 [Favolaschia claudopus]|uniref:Uncharacterized protein n=1 Tax=Favolaschia claudopus TaxID=2862362 RepID=A0AAV9ZEY2_9AGAR
MTVLKNIVGHQICPQMAYEPWLELERLNGARRVDYHRVNQTSQRSLVSWQGLGVSTSTARQHQTRDVKVGDNPTARTLSFGKEIEEHAIQQGSVRVNNGMQQDVGELAAHSSPLERKGNQGHRSQGRDVFKQQPTIIRPETQSLDTTLQTAQTFSEGKSRKPSYGNGELGTQFLAKRVPKREEFGATTTAWEGIGGNT